MRITAVIALTLLVISTSFAESPKAGDVVSVRGTVKLYEPESPRGQTIDEVPAPIFDDSIVKTFRNGNARITFIDGTRVILDPYAVLSVTDIRNMAVDGGTVIFDVKKRGRAKGLSIRTKTAVIGVKGTRFAVSMPDNDTVNVFLKSGSIVCEAVEGQFKRYAKQTKDEFADFMNQTNSEFDDYRTQMEDEFVEYVNEFEMKPNMAVTMTGSEVRNIEIPQEIEDAFREMDEAF